MYSAGVTDREAKIETGGRPRRAAAAPAGKPIVLVGLMGSGKSTIGRRLAARLGLPFVDADAEIELASGLSIAEIFERYGEAHFRDGERRVIARLIDGSAKVLATGGGAFINAATRALILDRAVAVWLDADLKTLVERVARRGNRPLLSGRDPAAVLADLAAVRNPIYAEAHIRIASQPSPHDTTVTALVAALAAHSSSVAALAAHSSSVAALAAHSSSVAALAAHSSSVAALAAHSSSVAALAAHDADAPAALDTAVSGDSA